MRNIKTQKFNEDASQRPKHQEHAWATKKASVQTEVMYGKNRVVVTILKSSFLPEEQKKRISRGYCRDVKPNRIYWA